MKLKGGQVDTFILDFEKAFDTPPHELLKCKLYGYGIGGKTLKWKDSFPCFRQQRVVVNGVKSYRAPFCQVSLRAPFLDHCCSHCILMISQQPLIRQFADDCICYHEIKYTEDTVKLQEDIDVLAVGQGNGA